MLIGYACVSTTEQTLDLQKDALTQAGCQETFTDIVSGAKTERAGDTLVVWRLDRLGRSLPHLIEVITRLEQREIGFKSLTEQIDTTTAGGKLVFHLFGTLAEFERDLIRERTQAGLQSARARGRQGGRPRVLSRKDPKTVALAQQLYRTQQTPVGEICKLLGISRATFYRSLATKQDGGGPS